MVKNLPYPRNFLFAKSVVGLCIFVFCTHLVMGQAASATWSLTANGNSSPTGNVSAGAATYAGATASSPLYDATNGIGAYNWPTADAKDNAKYFQFTISPTAGNNLTVTSISLYTYEPSGWDMHASVFYSTNGFGSSTQAGSQITVTSTSSQTNITGLSVSVPDGNTMTVRVYGYWAYGTSSSYPLRVKTVVISGSTVSSNSAPNAPTLYNTGGGVQLTFNNSYINSTTPVFRVSTTDPESNVIDYRIEIDDNPSFTSINWTQDFTNAGSHYSSGSTNNLTCSALSGIVNGTTYNVRVKAIDPTGSNTYGSYNSTTYSFTYKSSGAAEWLQTTTEQFNIGTLTNTITSSNSVYSVYFYWFDNMENGVNGWTVGEDVDPSSLAVFQQVSPAAGYYQSATKAWWIDNANDNYRGWLISPSFSIPSYAATIELSFYHRMFTENGFDGGNLQYSINAGAWTTVASFTLNGYSGTTGSTCPSGSFSAWEGTIGLQQVKVDVPAGASGGTIQYRYKFECDDGTTAGGTDGWWIDDFRLQSKTAVNPGSIISSKIDYASFTGATSWNQVSFNDVETGSNIIYQIVKSDGVTLIPDVDLPGNSAGFGTSPINISGLNTTTYNQIYLKATLTYTTQSPQLLDWTVSCNYGSNESDIVEAGFDEPDNIAYTSYQAASGLTTVNAIKVGSFTIRDGGADLTDGDANTTALTDITFTVLNFANIRALAIFDGATNKKEVTSVTGSTAFNGIAGLAASDNSSKTFDLYATFKSTVTDNEQIRFTIASATANPVGSVFTAADAGGALTSITGDDNRIEVTADRFGYVQQPSNVCMGSSISPAVTIEAKDANNNRDLDFSGSVRVTSTGSLSGTPVIVAAVSGLSTFNTLSFSATGSAITLNAERNGTLDWDITSSTFDSYDKPTLSTTAISSVTTSSASSGGNISSDGNNAVTSRGVCWKTSTGPTIADSKTTDGSGTGAFSSSITGLSACTQYFVRAYATNSCGTSYGNEQSFYSNCASSDIVSANNETTNIDYASKQSASINSTSDAIRVWSFTIRDGGGASDADALSTILTAVTIDKGGSNGVSSWANTIRQAALYDGTTEIAEISVSGETMAFSSLSVTAADNGTKTLDLYLTFESAVTDNQQFQFRIQNSNVTSSSSGSSFSAFAAVTSSVTGDNDRIEVTATQLKYIQQPTDVIKNSNISPAVTIEAIDANNNRDLDFTTTIKITASGSTLTGSPVTAVPVSGLATYSTLQLSTSAIGVTLLAQRNATSDWDVSSSAFNVIDVVTVPSANTNTGSVNDPFGMYYGYERTAMIYTSAEIGQFGTITKVGYYLNSVSSPANGNVKIYLKQTASSSLSGSTVAAEEAGAILVFDGTPSLTWTAGAWNTITLSTSFVYTADNLEVITETNFGGTGGEGASGKQFRWSNGAANCTEYWNQDNTPPAGNGALTANRPNVQFTMYPNCTAPTTIASSFSASAITTNSMDYSFIRGNGTGGVIVIAKAGSAPSDPVSGNSYSASSVYGSGSSVGGGYCVYNGTASGISNPTGNIAVTGLAAGTTYYFAVYEYNTVSTCYNMAELGGSASTLCSEPTTQASSVSFSAVTANSMTVSWTRGGTPGDGVIVLIHTGAVVDSDPVDGTGYTASATPTGGTQIGTGNYVVYLASGTSVNMTGLASGITYHYKVYEKNCTGGSSNYRLTSAATGSQTTTFIAPTLPTLYNTAAGSSQVIFQNARVMFTELPFAASATGTVTDFYFEINTASDFSGSAYIQTISGSYTGGTKYDVLLNSLSPALPTTDGVTYFVRMKAKNGASAWSAWSTATAGCDLWPFTYSTSNLGWHLTNTTQFNKWCTKQLQGLDDFITWAGDEMQVNEGSFSVTASSSGVYETADWYPSSSYNFMTIGYQSSSCPSPGDIDNGIRFSSVKIPNTPDILTTTLNMYGSADCPCYDAAGYSCLLSAHDVDNAPVLSASLPSFPRTTANKAFTGTGSGNVSVTAFQTVVEEVTGRAGWAAGNFFSIIIDRNGADTDNGCVQQSSGASPPTISGTYSNFQQQVKFPNIDRALFYGTTEWDKLTVNYDASACGSCYVKFYVYNNSSVLKYTSPTNPSGPLDISAVTDPIIYVVAEIYRNNSPRLFDITISAKGQALPVELVEFSGRCADNSTRISWTTLSEINNSFFTLERSRDAKEFVSLVKIPGAGNSNTPQQYEYFDLSPFRGLNFYKLKQTDYDGQFKYSDVIAVECDGLSHDKISVFSSDNREVFVSIISQDGNSDFLTKIFDSNGKSVFESVFPTAQGDNVFKIDASQFATGIYLVVIRMDDEVTTRKLMIR